MTLVSSSASFTEKAKQQALIKAVENDFVTTVMVLLSTDANGRRHVDPNFVVDEKNKMTPLHLALKNLEIVKALLENGADPNAQNVHKKTALHLVGGHRLVARILIRHGADPDIQDISNDSALHKVCRDGYLETAKELAWADPNATNKSNATPLHCAARAGNMDIVSWLINEAGANPKVNTKFPPFEAAFRGRLMPRGLIELGFDPWQHGEDGDKIAHACMRISFENDDEDETQSFRYRFADELFSCDTSLVHATDYQGCTPLHWAAQISPAIVRLLVGKYGADLMAKNSGGSIPLIDAVWEMNGPNVECVLELMKEKGFCIDEADKNGWTALHHAIFRRHDESINILLQFGADCTKVDQLGRTPLHLAGFPFPPPSISPRSYGKSDIARILDSKGFPAGKAERDERRMDSLMGLLARGIDVTLPDKDGNLPFFLSTVTSRVPDIFLMIRAAATQGLFERALSTQDPVDKKRKSTGDWTKGDEKRNKTESDLSRDK